MILEFGLYEVTMLALIAGAFIHGTYVGAKGATEKGAELTLKYLENINVIAIDEETGEITPVKH
jgi:hypothetical protein